MQAKLNPLISVIVPSYNHAQYLPERLLSIKNQSYSNIDIILLDDASKDNSAKILREFQITERRVSCVDINQHNSGSVNQQWLKGLRHAKGEFIWIAESDDVASPDFLTTLYQQFANVPELGLAYCDSLVVDEKGNPVESYDYRFKYFKNIWDKPFVADGKSLIRDYLIFRNVIPNVSAVLFKKNQLERALQQHDFVYLGDWICYIKLALNAKVAFVKQELNFFRKHINTTRWHDKRTYNLAVKEKIALLRMIKYSGMSGTAENITLSLSHLYSNRHKYKRVFTLLNVLSKADMTNKNIALYGYNDICDILVTEFNDKSKLKLIFDKNKVGLNCQGIPVVKLSQENLSSINVIVICSLEHANSMEVELGKLNYSGLTLII
jgi:glycosyltransferase involved in cell wall biosynthesis